ncbi:MAG: carboxylating nicotinate-nucleotide diphosphorylase [bacterium]
MELLDLEPLIDRAIMEDIGKGDLTTTLCLTQNPVVEAQIIANESGIIAGIEIAELVFKKINKKVKFEKKIEGGKRIKKGDVVASIKGNAQDILSTERVALNFLQHLSGIATLTSKFVEAVKPYKAKIYDTRKTLPTLRAIEKYAVRTGGGNNHRFGLYDGILIKDNHIGIVGGITQAVKQVQQNLTTDMKVEVETKNLDEVKEAVDINVDIIMLDNMSLEMILEAVKIIKASKKDILIEVSGGVSLENVNEIASTGVDIISIGALTHSAKALDLSLEIK